MAIANMPVQKRKRGAGSAKALPRKKTRTQLLGSSMISNSSHVPRIQKLPDDLLWYIARTFLWSPTEIFDLARTSHRLWRVLEKEIFITDVFAVKYCCSISFTAPPRTTLLHWGALAGRTDILQKAIEAGRLIWVPYMNYQHTKGGHAAIHFAAHYGHLEAIKLLDAETSVDITAASGWICPAPQSLRRILERLAPGQFRVPPDIMLQSSHYPFKIDAFGLAILKGHRDTALYLMKHYDEERNIEHGIFPPLHLAAFVGMHEIVSAILKRGTDVNSRCKHVVDSIAIQWAVACAASPGRKQTCEILIRAGADPTIRDGAGRTALDWAIGFKLRENVLWLLGASAELTAHEFYAGQVEAWTKRLQRCMADDLLLDCTKFILHKYPRLPSECLKLCAQSTFWDIDRSWDDPDGLSTASKNIKTKRWLVEEGIGLGLLRNAARRSWMQDELFLSRSFLHYAAGSNDVDVGLLEEVVVKRPFDINLVDGKGLTPLELAMAFRCQAEKVELLLQHGADPALCYRGERARADIDKQIRELANEED